MNEKQTDQQAMAANVQILYPDYCAIIIKEADLKGYIRGRAERQDGHQKIIDAQARLIVKLTAACGKLRGEIDGLKMEDV